MEKTEDGHVQIYFLYMRVNWRKNIPRWVFQKGVYSRGHLYCQLGCGRWVCITLCVSSLLCVLTVMQYWLCL